MRITLRVLGSIMQQGEGGYRPVSIMQQGEGGYRLVSIIQQGEGGYRLVSIMQQGKGAYRLVSIMQQGKGGYRLVSIMQQGGGGIQASEHHATGGRGIQASVFFSHGNHFEVRLLLVGCPRPPHITSQRSITTLTFPGGHLCQPPLPTLSAVSKSFLMMAVWYSSTDSCRE